MKFSIRRP